jgi:hypothetical protein
MEWKTKAKIGEAPVSRYTHTGTVVPPSISTVNSEREKQR